MSISSSSSSSSCITNALLPDHLSPSEQLCYVQCNFCDTVLAVSVPCSSLFKTVTVRCGHCSNLLSVKMRGHILPSANQFHVNHALFNHQNIMNEIRSDPPATVTNMQQNSTECFMPAAARGLQDIPKPPVMINRPPEKRQRVPSAYNRFIKEEIQRIKAVNPDISHREAFSAAAKNWAHFPHIHFGLMPDQQVKKPKEAEDMVMRDGLFSPANVGVSPY